ncbi:MAG: cytochrome c biogenesis protein CcdA [Alphaproteobacteria bacterium]
MKNNTILKNFFCILLFVLCLIGRNAFAVSQSVSTDRVTVKLITDKNCVKPNEDLEVLVKLQMKEGWHTYWKNPGDSGEETKIKWKLPSAYSDELIEISSPSVYITEGIYQYGYDDVAYFLLKLKNHGALDPKSDKIPEEYSFSTEISWIACGEECVTEKVSLSFTVNVNMLDHIPTTEWKKEKALADKTFPKETNWKSLYEILDEETLLLNFSTSEEFDEIQKIKFLPYQKDIISNAEPQIFGQEGKNLSLKITLDDPNIKEINGVLIIDDVVYDFTPKLQKGLSIYAEKQNLPDEETVFSDIKTEILESEQGFLGIILFAFLGGLILNLMPCIFPILTLKALSLINGSQNKRENKIEGLMYLLGVVVCFLGIATLLVFLREIGEKVGWGFQLQSPLFVIIMIVIFFIIFLMMLDIVTIKNPFNHVGRISFKEQRLNAFITGLFSVLIATPCTAPFMGTAIGYTLSKPLYVYYPVFVALSLGYALPFTLLGFFPHLIHKLLPKPGKWMITLKKILSIPILLTCIWLTWVLYNQVNTPIENFEEATIVSQKNIPWQKYDAEKIENLITQGKPVFIDFTAKWCITCLANKKIALETNIFAELVKEKELNVFQADWTNYSPEIEYALKKYGRNSIPLYVYYPAGSKNYILLPQLITPSILKKYINN